MALNISCRGCSVTWSFKPRHLCSRRAAVWSWYRVPLSEYLDDAPPNRRESGHSLGINQVSLFRCLDLKWESRAGVSRHSVNPDGKQPGVQPEPPNATDDHLSRRLLRMVCLAMSTVMSQLCRPERDRGLIGCGVPRLAGVDLQAQGFGLWHLQYSVRRGSREAMLRNYKMPRLPVRNTTHAPVPC